MVDSNEVGSSRSSRIERLGGRRLRSQMDDGDHHRRPWAPGIFDQVSATCLVPARLYSEISLSPTKNIVFDPLKHGCGGLWSQSDWTSSGGIRWHRASLPALGIGEIIQSNHARRSRMNRSLASWIGVPIILPLVCGGCGATPEEGVSAIRLGGFECMGRADPRTRSRPVKPAFEGEFRSRNHHAATFRGATLDGLRRRDPEPWQRDPGRVPGGSRALTIRWLAPRTSSPRDRARDSGIPPTRGRSRSSPIAWSRDRSGNRASIRPTRMRPGRRRRPAPGVTSTVNVFRPS